MSVEMRTEKKLKMLLLYLNLIIMPKIAKHMTQDTKVRKYSVE